MEKLQWEQKMMVACLIAVLAGFGYLAFAVFEMFRIIVGMGLA